MRNNIPILQNHNDNLELQASKTRSYTLGKRISTLRFAALLAPIVFGNIMVVFYPGNEIWIVFFSLFIFIVDVAFLESAFKHYKDVGARIQEIFDVNVLQLPWNSLKLGDRRLGNQPEIETIKSFADKVRGNSKVWDHLRNWYPEEVGEIPLGLGRLICQRANVRWDATQRLYFIQIIKATSWILVLGLLVIGIIARWDIEKLVMALVAPALPLAARLIQLYRLHSEVENNSQQQRKYSELVWEKGLAGELTGSELELQARNIQDSIFERRCNSPWIPEMLYRRLRPRLEKEMNEIATKLVEDWKQSSMRNQENN